MTGRDIIQDALREIGVLAAGDTATAEDAELGRVKLSRLLDNWNAERAAVYCQVLTTYTLVPSLSPHTIGPTGTFVVAQRPVTIDGAGLILATSTPNVRVPLRIRDFEWWTSQAVKALTTTMPTDLYYEPDWPNGKLFFWPVSTTAYAIELETRVLLAQLGLDDPFSLPPGYQDAVTLSLAESLLGGFPTGEIAALVIGQASKARARVWSNNTASRRIATRDAGMPGSGGGWFSYITRRWEP